LVAPEHTSGNLDTEACAVDKIVDTAITNDPPDSTPFNSRHANGSTASTWNQQNSTNFSQLKNAVPYQGVGGSNPLSPANIFKQIQAVFRLPKNACRLRL
jgi:hypothetical protein